MRKWLIGALLAATVWTPANAQENHDWRTRQGSGEERGRDRGERPARPQAQAQAQVQAQPQAAPAWRTRTDGDRGGWRGRAEAQQQIQAPRRDWRTSGQARDDGQRRDWQRQGGAGRPDLTPGQRFDAGQGRVDQFRSGDNRRDRYRPDQNRADQYRAESGRDGRFDQNDRRQTDNRRYDGQNRGYGDRGYVGQRDDNRGYGGQRYGDRGGNWNRDWRRDGRFDWNRYRTGNRAAFRLPRYYSPYGWNYGYRRFSVGVTLSSVLWGQNYWIDDPYDYRLPEAYGPYRWVRYYDDALLVDLRSGQVIDTVYGIFW